MRIIFWLFATVIMLSACSKEVKETIGIVTPGPDEYKVGRNKTLEMPPHYDLPAIKVKDKENSKSPSPETLTEGEQALIKEIEK